MAIVSTAGLPVGDGKIPYHHGAARVKYSQDCPPVIGEKSKEHALYDDPFTADFRGGEID
jgi:hypothetical protein